MKIKETSEATSYRSTATSKTEDQSFETLLVVSTTIDTPAHATSGDEYYWQHQQQLQPSELSFDHRMTEKNSALKPTVTGISKLKSSHQEKPDPLHVPAPPPTPEKPIKTSTVIMTNYQTLVAHIREIITQIPPHLGYTSMVKEEIKIPRLSKPCSDTTFSTIIPFKNHQLFIVGHHVELTLNTYSLNPQQTREITQLIKQWLACKGLRLRKFMINGVEQ